MKLTIIRFSAAVLLSLLVMLFGVCELGHCFGDDQLIKMKLGGVHDCKGSQNSAEIDSLARFAVLEHNKKENTLLEFEKVLKAKEQVVSGKIYYLTLEAIDAGRKTIYEAKVWVKPWMNFMQLQEFKHAHDAPFFTQSDMGAKRGWQTVPTHDPEVQDAANHAVKSIQQRSNSLSPYELLEILLAKAKVIEEHAKFDLLLKLRRGIMEVKFRVEVNKNIDGKFYLGQFEQDNS
ncbi:cysteine proteinase inhibitor 12-like isoform X2 [Juglans microcarpa x Juglans regia]|uniref:cysteine proteinase inhibitor 12-like isoform X2 n=1 Tax=Juglans microcarpa x Juglans regia TaxID=2249226 RepID=UPI001B7E1E80|nr:cysteine proteinase inhibitor 12-like isoform X2 [Juglans microcarpa x Juglans regia]